MSGDKKLGEIGEGIAASYLQKKGYRIMDRNWRFRKAEIDIICKKEDLLVIVEVKSRKLNAVERPQDAVTITKQKRIINAADAYIQEKEIDLEGRFDVISVVFKGTNFEIEHLESAFTPLL